MRGQQALTSILPTSLPNTKPEDKGHRNRFIDQRDEALAARFYYHSHLKRMRYDDCLLRLESEFYITALVIQQRLTAKSEFLKTLVNRQADRRFLRKKHPFLNWD